MPISPRLRADSALLQIDIANGSICGTIGNMQVVEYIDIEGKSPFAHWFAVIGVHAAARVTFALARIAAGNLSNIKSVGGGVLEYRLDYGPGYRIYFGRHGNELIILLAGGTKKRQQNDIAQAQHRWRDYKTRKQGD